VLLSFTASQAAYILSQPLHASQKLIRQSDESVDVELDVYITTELKMAILSYGPEVKVLKPKSLQSEIEKTIRDMAAMYKQKPVTTI
jgi:predicted DNA-binding transcriptional regulator YafY